MARNDLQGSLDLLVLKTLWQMGEMHGYGVVLHIQRASDELLSVEEGSLYPALHRMQQSGWTFGLAQFLLSRSGQPVVFRFAIPSSW